MCGLTGFFRPGDPSPVAPKERKALAAMCAALTHRGPDEDGSWTGPGLGLAARRLSIIDIKASHQPQRGPSGKTHCVFNGEIYNYRAIRDELLSLGYNLSTEGDTEILPCGYEAWGIEGLLQRLNGMFAFALYDERTQDLILARDRLGIKPLYLGHFEGTYLFGSELKSLLPHPAFKREVDPEALSRYLVLEYIPAPLCIYRGVEKVLPGHYVRISNQRGVERKRYWSLRWTRSREDWAYPEFPLPRPGDNSEAAWIPILSHALRESVRARLVSEVPIGALLSGGVDSSSISALMSELVPDLRTFSVDFEERSFDESPFSQAVAQHIGSEHQARTFESRLFPEVLEQVLSGMDEPFADASLLPTHFLSQSVKDSGVTVVLSGDGADELFAGYPTYFAQTVAGAATALPIGSRILSRLGELADFLPSSYTNISPDYVARRFLQGACLPPARRQATWLGAFRDEEMRSVLAHEVVRSLSPDSPWAEIDGHFETAAEQGASQLEQLLYLDLMTYMSDDILVKVDRASMASSLEVRVPFLDHRVVELAARIPERLKLNGRTGKYLLKRAMGPRLPAATTRRPKKGFGLPVGPWLRGSQRELLCDLLSSGAASRSGWLHQATVDNLLDDHLCGRLDRRKPLWTLFMFRQWEEGPYGPKG